MLLDVLLLMAGFIVLIKGADFLVDGASSLAKKYSISPLIIGLTIVSFGTSAPEIAVNIFSSINGKSEALFGNILGSNMFNLMFILGLSGIIYPLAVQRNTIRYEVPYSLFAIILMFILANDVLLFGAEKNVISTTDSLILLGCFGLFLYYIYLSMRKKGVNDDRSIKEFTITKSILMSIGGIVMLVGGGKLTLDSALNLAHMFGLSEKLIGLTILAVGTSLPELATSVIAAIKKNTDIAIGNIVGSNIFNIFLVLGVSGVVSPIDFNPVMNLDMSVLAIGTLILLVSMFTMTPAKLDRWEAFVLLVAYIAYTFYLIIRN
ncbi:MAG TPA: calcium/sodium antiporter [Cyclobacteriaceae bacterium]|nr:calcium/sodium antiporter [Cyclobacteriaceae bacterium]